MPLSDIRLRGEHNLMNVLAACAIAYAAGLPTQAMQAGIQGFAGVPHRLQFVRSWHGADWYNDSIATAPERSMADIRSFSEPLILLAGGRDKNLPWEDLAAFVHERVDHVVIFGEAAEKIIKAITTEGARKKPYTYERVDHLKAAVLKAAEVAEPGDVVLFSPGGTSFDEFMDFEERGEKFRSWVQELA
jgi:UDP-N-acetylmuramoylalanine--D-glutamate ligase